MAIAAAWFLSLLLTGLALTDRLASDLLLLGACVLTTVVGAVDDHRSLAARWRMLIHVAAAVAVLVALGGMPPIPFGATLAEAGLLGAAIGVLYLVWLLNLYNFMDGIDGIAGIEAVTVAAGASLLMVLTGATTLLPAILALGAAAMGFLFWNFPRARIFMGDGGSGFIGITFGVLSLVSTLHAPALFWGWVILLGVFIVDASVTLFRRIWRSEVVHEAHRSHAYQYAARRVGSHAPVSLMVGVINLLWLLPIAALVVAGHIEGVLGVVVAYLPLIGLAYYFKAGARELQEV
jgi:Fuc2NAc and GlcNAc transferase